MTRYLVKTDGNDGNDGESDAQAWLTVDHAANNVAAGDEVWIGAGVYPEMVTLDTPGTSGSEIKWYGDVAGQYVGPGGLVLITAHDAIDGASVRDFALDVNYSEFNEFRFIVFEGGNQGAIGHNTGTTDHGYEGMVFEDCGVFAGEANADKAIYLEINDGEDLSGSIGLKIHRCRIHGKVYIEHDNQESGHYDLNWWITHCVYTFKMSTSEFGVYAIGMAVGTYSIGGIHLDHCTLIGGYGVIYGRYLRDDSNPLIATNCVSIGQQYGFQEGLCTNDCIEEGGGCIFHGVGTLVLGDVKLSGSYDAITRFPFMGGFGDEPYRKVIGWTPYLPFEPLDISVAVGAGAGAETEDFYARPRPMSSEDEDSGAVEMRSRPLLEEGTVPSGMSTGAKVLSRGIYDFFVPVSAASTTITVACRYDSSYTGDLPRLLTLYIPQNVAQETDTMVAAADTWEDLAVTFTPTAAGMAWLRVEARDSSESGNTYFGDIRKS